MTELRTNDLAKIHIAAKDLGMDRETYEAMLWTVARVRSSRDLDVAGRAKVLTHLKALGWKPSRRKVSPKSRHKRPHEKTQADKIRALWIELKTLGALRDSSEKALGRYIHRMTGKHSPDWLDPDEASQVIESLKRWIARVESE